MSFGNPITVGPWGGQDGLAWDDGVYTTVRQLVIAHGIGIDSILIEYDKNGSSVWSQKHGGNGGTKTDRVKLNSPDEFLTSVHGHYGWLIERGPVFIRSLTLESNKKTYGPFGIEQGTYFSLPTTGGKIIGFHGKSGWYLDAIGVHLKPHKSSPLNSIIPAKTYFSNGCDRVAYSVVQGGVARGYDVIVAFRQKDDSYINDLPSNFPKQTYYSGGSSDSEKGKVGAVKKMSYSNTSPHSILSRQTPSSGESSDAESKGKKASLQVDGVKKLPYSNTSPHNHSRQTSSSGDSSDRETKGKTTGTERLPLKVRGAVTYGPWGGKGGFVFDDGINTGVRQIYLSRNVGIVSIKVLYDQNGQAVWGSKHGGTGGFKNDKIAIDYPYEVLTHISGYYAPTMVMGPNIIKSLTFHTTKTKYGPFGEEQGTPFSSNLKEGVIVGFHGRTGWFLDAVGVHILEGNARPATRPPSNKQLNQNQNQNQVVLDTVSEVNKNPLWRSNKPSPIKGGPFEEVGGVVKEPAPCGPGPWGGDGGRPWDDGVFSGIKQIYLTRAEAICSIQIEYDRNGQSIWSTKHGGDNGTTTHRVRLEYPHEVVSCMCGYYGPISKDEPRNVVKSLTFYTSRGKYGPFGEEIGTFFTSTTTEGKVVGFHGRSSLFLDAIGVHMQHWLGAPRTRKPNLFKLF